VVEAVKAAIDLAPKHLQDYRNGALPPRHEFMPNPRVARTDRAVVEEVCKN
jgi:hypothetical protein